VPSTGGKTLEKGRCRGGFVEMKWLRIELSGERLDALGGDGYRITAGTMKLSWLQVLKVQSRRHHLRRH
jgi:hypothetical protein